MKRLAKALVPCAFLLAVAAAYGQAAEGRAITVTIGDVLLEDVLYDTPLAKEISGCFPP